MTTVKAEIRDGTTYNQAFEGNAAAVVYDVSGLRQSGQRMLTEACAAAGIPALGDRHPSDVTLIVRRKSARPLGPDSARVTVEYAPPDPLTQEPQEDPSQAVHGVIEVGATVQQATTQLDVNGRQITVQHTYNEGTAQQQTVVTGADVDIYVPQHILRATRRERYSPHDTAKKYVGRINYLGIWGYGARELLSTRISGVSNDGGQSYEVTYEFQYNADTWDATLVYRDQKTGLPPQGLRAGEGIKTVQIYPTISFSGLGLQF